MNKVQKEYAAARARREAIEQTIEAMEGDFIRGLGIINPDGSVPDQLCEILDQKTFDYALNAFVEAHGDLETEFTAASKALASAEDALIDWGISIAPAGVRDILSRNKKNGQFRPRLIDLSFRLDAKTVPKGV